ncbi:phospholipid/cholesterol/gamma-HCH transport system substrate-binding protein [Azotobacter beijerinckii]|uniref:Phospholipid/cholesterol/gamma-HCH transport system substrate-binding protein n=1 Tax=Azotobacter beijerinckii TaxID=170623 RepID=A0A1H9E0T9_9GAMM|nr:MlaD family protein [Azotobacter beijerinckii]SEQ19285.1 phospholipid/cholesterol/gamma-HCH transport system substrate-binding protein [Azotobacter beijerinckii]
METRAHHVLIGLFTVLAVLAALLLALWLGKSSLDRDFDHYEVLFNHSVSGLGVGSPVEYSGIRVGDVEQLWLDPQDPRMARASIRLDSGTPIKRDTHARLLLANITGARSIQLFGGTPQSAPLKGEDGRLPLIVADPSPLSALLDDGGDLMSDVNNILSGASHVFSADNITHFGRTLANLEQATGALAEQRSELRQAMQQLNQLGQKTGLLLEEVTRLTRNANGLLDGSGRQLLASAQRSMTTLERTSTRLDRLLEDNHKALDDGLNGIAELGPAIGELRATLGGVRRVTRHLEDNPSGFFLGREQMQEFAP